MQSGPSFNQKFVIPSGIRRRHKNMPCGHDMIISFDELGDGEYQLKTYTLKNGGHYHFKWYDGLWQLYKGVP